MTRVETRSEPGPGERADRARRRRLRTTWIVLGLAGFAIGVATGIDSARHGSGGEVSPALAIAGAVFLIAGLLGATWYYFRHTDELDVRDNLIAGNVALYFYAIAYPCWVLLARGGLVPRTDSEILYVATLVVLVLAYFWKRLRP